MEITILSLLWLTFLLQVGYHLFIFHRVNFYDEYIEGEIELEAVSVIICAKNEENNLIKNLPYILEQDYFQFEVLVINDNSTDNSEEILKKFQMDYQHFRYLNVKGDDHGWQGKKKALTFGITSSRHNLLLLTDADTHPNSNQWIKKMVSHFQPHIEIILGYSPYNKRSGLLNLFIRYETFQTAIQYFSMALAGLPYMGVGRNLAYRKELFQETGGFEKHNELLSGDDDLFVNENANSRNTAICLDRGSFMESEAETRWRSWFTRKRRHLSAGFQYKAVHKLLLGGYTGSQILFYLFFMLCIVTGSLFLAISLFLVRLLAMGFVYSRSMKKLEVNDLWIYFPFLDVLYTFYYIIFLPLSLIKPNLTWK